MSMSEFDPRTTDFYCLDDGSFLKRMRDLSESGRRRRFFETDYGGDMVSIFGRDDFVLSSVERQPGGDYIVVLESYPILKERVVFVSYDGRCSYTLLSVEGAYFEYHARRELVEDILERRNRPGNGIA